MAEKCFDVNGVEIMVGDTVELVRCTERDAGPPYKLGLRLAVDGVEPSQVDGHPGCFIEGRLEGSVERYFTWGDWRIVDFRGNKDGRARDVAKAVVEVRDTWPTTEAPTSAQTPASKSVPPETFTRFGQEQAARAAAGNPKDAIGSSKAPTTCVPATIQAEDGLAMLEGALKYGRHNYRAAQVRASVYLDALRRHVNRWIEGEDIDPDSDLSHLTKARACLGILRDAQICGTLIDDRPPPAPIGFFVELDKKAAALVAKYPDPVAPYVANDPRMAAPRLRDPVEVELDALKRRTAPRG